MHVERENGAAESEPLTLHMRFDPERRCYRPTRIIIKIHFSAKGPDLLGFVERISADGETCWIRFGIRDGLYELDRPTSVILERNPGLSLEFDPPLGARQETKEPKQAAQKPSAGTWERIQKLFGG